MVFKVPAPAGHLKKNRFHFELGGEILSLPKMEFVPPDADDFLKDMSPDLTRKDFVLGFIEACDPEVGKKVHEARLHRDQVYALQDAWIAASKLNPGESSASESS